MNLNELRQAIASDATKENERLKREVNLLREQLRDSKKQLRGIEKPLIHDCQALANRCWALTLGTMCCFCEFDAFKCPHAMNYKQKIDATKKLIKEMENKYAEN